MNILITGAGRGLGLELATQYAKDGWQVIGIDIAHSKLGLPSAELQKLRDTCKLEVKSSLLTLGEDPSTQLMLAVVGLRHDAFDACIDRLGDQAHRANEGVLTQYTVGARSMWAWWPTPDTLVSSRRDALQALAAGGPRLVDNDDVMAMIGKADTDAMLWVAGRADTGATAWLAGKLPGAPNLSTLETQLGARPKKLWFSMNLTSQLSARGGLVFGDSAAAATAKRNLTALLASTPGIDLAQNAQEVTARISRGSQEGEAIARTLGLLPP